MGPLDLEISGIVPGGRGLARTENGVIFVEGSLPGELVRAEISERKRSWTGARTVEVLRPAPERIPPHCPHHGTCGGCDWQHIDYAAQVRFKESILAESLRRIAGISPPFLRPLTGAPLGYRHRVRFQTDGRGTPGFFRKQSRVVIPVDRCPVIPDELNRVLARLHGCRDVLPRRAEISLGLGPDGVVARMTGRVRASGRDLLEMTGLSGCWMPGGTGSGRRMLSLDLLRMDYRIRPGGFFQANWGLNQKLVETVVSSVPEGARVLDLFAGAGNFALCFGGRGHSVFAVEGDTGLAADGRRNVRNNGLSVHYMVRNLDRSPDIDARELDAVVMDPPRSGANPTLLRWLVETRIPLLHYVSCDPATLSRDIGRLSGGYRVQSARVVDFFPQTSHIETHVVLERR